MSALLRVAMFTPLPPARTGTAEYAKQLAAELSRIVHLEVFESVRGNAKLKGFDAVIYQIANNPYHAAFYNLALERPGIAVLHEVNLHDLVREKTLHNGGQQTYLREVMYEVFGAELNDPNRAESFDVPQPRTFTIIRKLIDRSLATYRPQQLRGAITAAERLRRSGRGGPARLVRPACGRRAVSPEDRRRWSRAGHRVLRIPTPRQALFRVLPGVRESLEDHPGAHLLVAGEPHPEVPLRQWIQESGLERHVHVLDYLDIDDFDGNLAACDIILNLRNPTFGETSGTMMRAFGLGKTVIVSDTGACRDLPDDICLRIEPDHLEEPVLAACVNWLLEDRERLGAIGRRAREWVSETCTWEKTAQMYAATAESVAEMHGPSGNGNRKPSAKIVPTVTSGLEATVIESYLHRWVQPGSEAEVYFRTHADRLVRTLQRAPTGGKQDRILEMGCYMQVTPALRHLLGYGEVRGSYLGGPGRTDQTDGCGH